MYTKVYESQIWAICLAAKFGPNTQHTDTMQQDNDHKDNDHNDHKHSIKSTTEWRKRVLQCPSRSQNFYLNLS